MSTRDKNDKSPDLDSIAENENENLVNTMINEDAKNSKQVSKNSGPTSDKKSSIYWDVDKTNSDDELQLSSANSNQAKTHIVLDGGAIKGVEKLLADLIIERKKSRKASWFTKIMLTFILLGIVSIVVSQNQEIGVVKSHTALVRIDGVIMPDGPVNAEIMAQSLQAAFSDKNSKGVILAINSPGGSPVQSQLIYDTILRLKQQYQKPVSVVIADVGASGGYYIAAAADNIYASPASIIGSIGVRLDSFGVTDLMEKVGVESRTITAGKFKSGMDPFSPLSTDVEKHLQQMLDGVHLQFIQAVEAGRGAKLSNNKAVLYSGLFWNGQQALNLGLIDGYKTMAEVAAENNAPQLVDYTIEQDYLSRLAGNLGASISNSLYAIFTSSEMK